MIERIALPFLKQCLRSLLLFGLVMLAGLSLAQADDYTDTHGLIKQGKLELAQKKINDFLIIKPRDPQMRFLKGVVFTEQQRIDDAIDVFRTLTEDFPELPEPYNNLAVLYAGRGEYDKARAALLQALRNNPAYATAHENLGDIYLRLAAQSFEKAMQLDARNQHAPSKLSRTRELINPPR